MIIPECEGVTWSDQSLVWVAKLQQIIYRCDHYKTALYAYDLVYARLGLGTKGQFGVSWEDVPEKYRQSVLHAIDSFVLNQQNLF